MNVAPNSATQGVITAEVIIGNAPAPLYFWPDHHRLYVAGEPGASYMLRVTNRTSERIEIVASVDGRNIFRDEKADLNAPGFCLHPKQSYDFEGWMTGDRQHQRRFVFTDPSKSVASQAGEPSNIGVIGIGAYRERRKFPVTAVSAPGYGGGGGSGSAYVGDSTVNYAGYGGSGGTIGLRSANLIGEPVAVAAAGTSKSLDPALGTGAGERVSKPTTSTEFDRLGHPDLIVIGYNTSEVLHAAGIIVPDLPQPFPASSTGYDRYASV